jgi:SAM-dependent methyltransferase
VSGAPRDLSARSAYQAFAASYDAFNHLYQYERWTAKLLAAARAHGLDGNRLLDVACGTGLSFLPLLESGWRVTGCDISPAMLEIARAKAGDAAELLVADMRDLPALGEFDLIWSLNDSANYLLSVEDLESALTSMARNLAPGGVLVLDLNTLLTYESFFCETHTREFDGERFTWHGQMAERSLEPGAVFEARFEAAGRDADHVHRQRHFSASEVLTSFERAGLRCIAVLGEREGDLEPGLDEAIHTKAVYICSGAGSADLPAGGKS